MGLFRTCAGGASQYCVCSARPASERLPRCSPPRSILRRSLLPHCLWCWALAARPLWQRPCRQSATADRRESPPFFYLFFIFFPYGRGHVAKARPQIGGNRHLFICMYIYTCMYMYVCTYIHIYTYIQIYICICVCVCVCVYIYVHIHMYIYNIYIYTYIYICTYNIYIYIVCIHTYMYLHIHT